LPESVTGHKTSRQNSETKKEEKMDYTAVFVPGIFFAAIVAIVYLQVRKKERMALLQTGKDASVFDKGRKCGSPSLKYGLLLTGAGVGILLANILVSLNILSEDVAYFSMIFIFGGMALLVDFFLQRKEMQERRKNEEKEI
jgi:preprotein translocase subunit YajC